MAHIVFYYFIFIKFHRLTGILPTNQKRQAKKDFCHMERVLIPYYEACRERFAVRDLSPNDQLCRH